MCLYPLQRVHTLASDLAVEALHFQAGAACFTVANRGAMDVSDVGVAVVTDDRYSDHRYLRLPWLAAGASEQFQVPLDLPPGSHRIAVLADPEGRVIEAEALRSNNRAVLDVVL